MKIDVSIVIPVLNEEQVLPLLLQELRSYLVKITEEYEIIFVDDGSTDGSFDQIKRFSSEDSRIKGISFYRNFGHQNALLAGILHASGEYVVTMDADLQHPPALLPDLYEKVKAGYDVVGTVRVVSGASPIKEFLSESFYKVFNKISDVTLIPNSADYRIISQDVVQEINNYKNNSLFLRGFIASRGFKSFYLKFSAQKREHGESKYSLLKMLALAFSGITSFSYFPLKISFIFFGISLIFLIIYTIFFMFGLGEDSFSKEGFSLFEFGLLFLITGLFLNLSILGKYISKIHSQLNQSENFRIKNKVGI